MKINPDHHCSRLIPNDFLFTTHLISRYYLPFSYILRPKPMVVPYYSLPTHLSRKFADVGFERETQYCRIAQIFTILFVIFFLPHCSIFFTTPTVFFLHANFCSILVLIFLAFFLVLSFLHCLPFLFIFFFLSFSLSLLLFLMFPSMTFVLQNLKKCAMKFLNYLQAIYTPNPFDEEKGEVNTGGSAPITPLSGKSHLTHFL